MPRVCPELGCAHSWDVMGTGMCPELGCAGMCWELRCAEMCPELRCDESWDVLRCVWSWDVLGAGICWDVLGAGLCWDVSGIWGHQQFTNNPFCRALPAHGHEGPNLQSTTIYLCSSIIDGGSFDH